MCRHCTDPLAALIILGTDRPVYGTVQAATQTITFPRHIGGALGSETPSAYDAVEDGAIEAIRLGKQLRFRPSALLRYLDKHATNANGQ